MDRISSQNIITVGGKRQFTDGPPGTTISASHMNAVQEELINAIVAGGLTPSANDLTQLQQAITNTITNQLIGAVASTWTLITIGKSLVLSKVVFNGTTLIAVGAADTDAYILKSTDNGVTWAEKTNAKALGLRSVCWSAELNLWVAVGYADTDCYILTSADNGETWTERAPTIARGNPYQLNDVCWSPRLRLFLAVGDTGANASYALTSPDGTTWTERTTGLSTGCLSCAWNGQSFFVFFTSSSTSTSNDGTNFTVLPTAMSPGFSANRAATKGELIWIASQGGIIAFSRTGGSWSTVNLIFSAGGTPPIYDIGVSEFGYIVAGSMGILYSTQGVSWIKTATALPTILSCCFAGTRFVAIPNGNSAIYISAAISPTYI